MNINVLRPGLLTTVQDAGRYGFQKYGVIVGGAMDLFALRMANILVGNEEAAAGLEMTVMGPALEFTDDALIAICGGSLSPAVNGQVVPEWRPVYVKKGAVLTFEGLVSGCRAYLAIAGGFHVPQILGSYSTYLRAGIGGYEGRALKKGDVLQGNSPSDWARRQMLSLKKAEFSYGAVADWGISFELVPAYSSQPVVRVLRGAQFEAFTSESRKKFFETPYRVTPQSDRMGYRLSGEKMELSSPLELISEAVSAGTIQVPPEGQPIILLSDRQTTGGYPKVAHIITVDLPVIAQTKPGESVRFQQVSLEEAHALYIKRERDIKQVKQAIALRNP
ncbi:biotin-dependent carboxyltransferase family protein [Aneurinibacillus terranovensis]|uniref:5-oxoprolinase subunit C family protein n=1 Tax=Aneurinibacillus terranovensis TaxID=278991 RepID=UPI0004026B05|nr:biotin-dependent carboxyltransferase family protein [Aneurinibacillus terranovensis]